MKDPDFEGGFCLVLPSAAVSPPADAIDEDGHISGLADEWIQNLAAEEGLDGVNAYVEHDFDSIVRLAPPKDLKLKAWSPLPGLRP